MPPGPNSYVEIPPAGRLERRCATSLILPKQRDLAGSPCKLGFADDPTRRIRQFEAGRVRLWIPQCGELPRKALNTKVRFFKGLLPIGT